MRNLHPSESEIEKSLTVIEDAISALNRAMKVPGWSKLEQSQFALVISRLHTKVDKLRSKLGRMQRVEIGAHKRISPSKVNTRQKRAREKVMNKELSQMDRERKVAKENEIERGHSKSGFYEQTTVQGGAPGQSKKR